MLVIIGMTSSSVTLHDSPDRLLNGLIGCGIVSYLAVVALCDNPPFASTYRPSVTLPNTYSGRDLFKGLKVSARLLHAAVFPCEYS